MRLREAVGRGGLGRRIGAPGVLRALGTLGSFGGIVGMLGTLGACGGDKQVVDLEIDPQRLYLGEVSFDGEMPAGGYASAVLTITNESGFPVALTLAAYDDAHLCIEGFPDASEDALLALLDDAAFYVLNVGICAYDPGEATTEVETEILLLTDGTPASFSVPVGFVPVRGQETDSGG